MAGFSEPGYECEFTEQLPQFVRSTCPVCLLVLRDPHQVTCCGKSFCRACISRVQHSSTLCPACKQEEFEIYPDKGLRQELYGLKVYCTHRSLGCDWEGELGEISEHLNSDPVSSEQLEGCAFTEVMCLFCDDLYRRDEVERHQTLECPERPFTCIMCGEYESTYEDVITDHAFECKCRPVECPNSCGASDLQHQHLEEHVSSQCPLSLVECEFSDAGCEAKVHRRDLPSHLSTNIVTHMSLLARENRKLKKELQEQKKAQILLVKSKSVKERKRFKSLLKNQANFFEAVRSELEKKTAKIEKHAKKAKKTRHAR